MAAEANILWEIENTSNKTMFVKSLIANAGFGVNSFKLQVQGDMGVPVCSGV